MTQRLFPAGYLNAVSSTEHCEVDGCGWYGPLAGLPHCGRCGKHHGPERQHEGFCTVRGCDGQAINYGTTKRPKYGLFCRLHSVEENHGTY